MSGLECEGPDHSPGHMPAHTGWKSESHWLVEDEPGMAAEDVAQESYLPSGAEYRRDLSRWRKQPRSVASAYQHYCPWENEGQRCCHHCGRQKSDGL